MGSNQSCPNNHQIQSTDIKKFQKDEQWTCDNCQAQYKDVDKRWRCIKDCDYDICHECMAKWLPGLKQQRRTAESVAQDEVPHRHYLAYVSFTCDQCKDGEIGDRFFCVKCLFDRCYGCSLKSALQSDQGDWKSMSVSSEPIDEGESRNIFRADVMMKNDKTERFVLKSWKPRFFNEGFDMSDIAKVHMQALLLSKKFNNDILHNTEIVFRKPVLHKMEATTERGGRNVFVKGETVLLEPYIYGKFIRFNSNSGWINGSGRFDKLQAFTHFTWHSTKQMIVCNLQGVEQVSEDGDKDQDGYYLTDPVVCSLTTGKWGKTDLGPEGIMAFFKNHRCSSLCRGFDVPKLNAGGGELEKRKSKTYVHQTGQTGIRLRLVGQEGEAVGLALFAALAQALKD